MRTTTPLLLAVLALGVGAVATAQPDLAVTRSRVVWIDGGWFEMGSHEDDVRFALELCLSSSLDPTGQDCAPDLFDDETPAHRVYVSPYGIDRTEVTQASFRQCVLAGRCSPPRGAPNVRIGLDTHPVTRIAYREAERYCAFVGGRLPTEAEWEHAAGGDTDRRFPWGRRYNDRLANHGRGSMLRPQPDAVDGHRYAAPVGSYPDGASPFGVLDLAGNVWEWTADLYAADLYRIGQRVDPRGALEGGERIVRGGSWRFPPYTLRITNRARLAEDDAWPDVGFRCAYEAPRSSGRPPLHPTGFE